MADMRNALGQLHALEQLASGNTIIHRIHPLAKLAATAVFLVCLVSFGRYAVWQLMPYLFYPAVVLALAEVPYRLIFRRTLVAVPFCLFAGISNLYLDRVELWRFGSITISAGAVSLMSILMRTILCVAAVLSLVAVTPFIQLTDQLRRLRIPNIFVVLFEMTYRYISVLVEEGSSMVTAYLLRYPGTKRPNMRHMGPIVGQLLLRSFDRAERVYQAMRCRGYALRDVNQTKHPLQVEDWVFFIAVSGFSVLFRLVDVPMLLGKGL
ncbi:MAG: cobalt ECF transporter T component CbiQ [Clostridium sp.]|jgi:cobalt/nickel transport system permease protein